MMRRSPPITPRQAAWLLVAVLAGVVFGACVGLLVGESVATGHDVAINHTTLRALTGAALGSLVGANVAWHMVRIAQTRTGGTCPR